MPSGNVTMRVEPDGTTILTVPPGYTISIGEQSVNIVPRGSAAGSSSISVSQAPKPTQAGASSNAVAGPSNTTSNIRAFPPELLERTYDSPDAAMKEINFHLVTNNYGFTVSLYSSPVHYAYLMCWQSTSPKMVRRNKDAAAAVLGTDSGTDAATPSPSKRGKTKSACPWRATMRQDRTTERWHLQLREDSHSHCAAVDENPHARRILQSFHKDILEDESLNASQIEERLRARKVPVTKYDIGNLIRRRRDLRDKRDANTPSDARQAIQQQGQQQAAPNTLQPGVTQQGSMHAPPAPNGAGLQLPHVPDHFHAFGTGLTLGDP